MEFKDRRVIVTGGTKGIGKAIALAFARHGAWVAVNYSSDRDAAEAMARDLEGIGSRHMLLQADVSVQADVERMTQQVLQDWGDIEILVNNAGIIRDKMLMFLGEEDWDRVLDVNLKGPYLCSRAVLRSMVSRRWGRIVNITSPGALTGRAGQTNYTASKGGIVSFTKSLAKEMARLGITVNAVCPGVISTPMTDRLDEKGRQDLLRMIPMGRFGKPEEVASAVLYLCSGDAEYVTGQVLAVDGGLI